MKTVRRIKSSIWAICTLNIYYFDTRFPVVTGGALKVVLWLIGVFLRLRMRFSSRPRFSVLYVGHAYYNPWYLSRALRALGWQADVLNWDANPDTQIYYHGEDFKFEYKSKSHIYKQLGFYLWALLRYDIFHFSNVNGIAFGFSLQAFFKKRLGEFSEIYLLKQYGKKIVYSNNGCMDGVSQSAFAKWGPESVCSICIWHDQPSVCSDNANLAWGKFRNSIADFQCLHGGNRIDYNVDHRIHETPEFFCLDKEFWHPQLEIPETFCLPTKPEGTVWLYHAVGHRAERTTMDNINIKSSHVYLPLIKKMKDEGMLIELLTPSGIPNKEVRFLQAQADIFLEMLTFGWFGANVREAMMLGKPVICYIRPEWLEGVRQEIPDYAAELPIISATPSTVEGVLRDLIADPEKRSEIGQRSREFALKWYSAEAGGRRFDNIYRKLMHGSSSLRVPFQSKSAGE